MCAKTNPTHSLLITFGENVGEDGFASMTRIVDEHNCFAVPKHIRPGKEDPVIIFSDGGCKTVKIPKRYYDITQFRYHQRICFDKRISLPDVVPAKPAKSLPGAGERVEISDKERRRRSCVEGAKYSGRVIGYSKDVLKNADEGAVKGLDNACSSDHKYVYIFVPSGPRSQYTMSAIAKVGRGSSGSPVLYQGKLIGMVDGGTNVIDAAWMKDMIKGPQEGQIIRVVLMK